jgi:hypothetical protein
MDQPQIAPPVTHEFQWNYRYNLSEAQLMDAAAQCLTFAAVVMEDKITGENAQLWLLRAQWYMLRLTSRRQNLDRAFISGLVHGVDGDPSLIDQSKTQNLAMPSSLGPENQPNHRPRRTASTWVGQDNDMPQLHAQPENTERAICADRGSHSSHTWGDENENWCPGKNASLYPLDRTRPVKDNLQA